jgi:hypothetical protein
MTFRKLRIAWSVFWGLACILLVALWVRSYWRLDYCKIPIGALHIHTIKGGIIFFALPQRPDWKAGSVPMRYVAHHPVLSSPYSGWSTAGGFTISEEPPAPHLHLSFIAPIIVAAAAGVLVWIPIQFSLRTLLIVTTVVAAVLGLAVYTFRK